MLAERSPLVLLYFGLPHYVLRVRILGIWRVRGKKTYTVLVNPASATRAGRMADVKNDVAIIADDMLAERLRKGCTKV